MGPILAFRFRLKGSDRITGGLVVSTSFRVRGLIRLEHDELVFQWGGSVSVQEVGLGDVKDEVEVLPDESLVVPVQDLYRAMLVGGWLRPRLVLQARTPGALSTVPSAEGGTAEFWYARRDRIAAIEMANSINDAIALACDQGY
mgnify:CR=1 FL=1